MYTQLNPEVLVPVLDLRELINLQVLREGIRPGQLPFCFFFFGGGGGGGGRN